MPDVPSRRRLGVLARALPTVAVVRAALWLLPYDRWTRVVRAIRRRADGSVARGASVEDVTWGVRRASRFVPGATCLTRALSAQVLLSHAGHASELRIGVRREADGALHAHAWLEGKDGILIGGRERDDFATLFEDGPAVTTRS